LTKGLDVNLMTAARTIRAFLPDMRPPVEPDHQHRLGGWDSALSRRPALQRR